MTKHPSFACLLLSAVLLATMDSLAQKDFKWPSVRGTMYISEDYTRKEFPKLLIFTGIYDQKINRKILEEFEDIQLNALNGLDFLPPVNEYTEKELMSFYREYNFDYVITTEIKDRIADEGVLTQQIEVALFDVEKNLKTIIFVGRVFSTTYDQDEAIQKFFRAVVKELGPIFL